jgi:uncharacterized membrane protein YGL010W
MKLVAVVRAQIADYPRVHRARANLVVHLLAIPMFPLGLGCIGFGIVTHAWLSSAIGIACVVISVALQGWGHAMERERPQPFSGPFNFLLRLTTESLVVFPRYVGTGGWRHAWRR